jgi:Polysaccharide lyase
MQRAPSDTRTRSSRPALALATLAASVATLASSAPAVAAPLAVKVVPPKANASTSRAVSVRIKGAQLARNVALYVDGDLRRRDGSRPWRFGSRGKIRLQAGKHRLKVVARYRKRKQVRRRTVRVRDRQLGGPKQNRHFGVARNRKVKAPEVAAPPTGPVLFNGDWETGDLSQWDMIQRVADDRITIAQDPRRQGNFAGRFEVRPGDNIGDTSPRAEVASYLHEQEGEERYYRWFTYFDPNFPTEYEDDFITFTQWRAVDEHDAYTAFMVWGDEIELRRDGTRWSTPLVKGVWHEFIYHVKWSPDPNVGFIELWYDGELVFPKFNIETMGGSPGDAVENYVKQGLYKEDNIPTGVLYHDGFVSGTSLEAVKGI